ncbi:MAG: glycosyltransferase [Roseiarcus sp.]|jgi:glycosyltransferase involved in cell wall biosynthesis
MATRPRVSIVMAVYNGGVFLREAVDSILSQSFADFEFVIVDDGSVDATPGILAGYDDPRLRVHSLAHVGITGAVNFGLAACGGELIARMDADDVARVDRLACEVALMDAEPNVDIACSDIVSIDETGQAIGRQTEPRATNERIRDGLLFRRLVKPIINPTVLMRRRVIETLGGYRDFLWSEEHDFWLRAVDHFRFHRINLPLLKYRIHPGGVTRAKFAAQATSACMGAVNYLVEKQTGVDLYADDPKLFLALSTFARGRLDRTILPAARAFRTVRESMAPGRIAVGYWRLAKVVLRHGPIALPSIARRGCATVVEEIVQKALHEIRSRVNAPALGDDLMFDR